ncbi:UDP-galactopyranose mutase [Mumia flava]|uniref:UDP-galactopyranose mutase n=1 Tax=Mumia flava TaxID=1348852 RepID=A0A2M9BDJ9_9ACTN|nr:UDP-galactopyranose mutase [Mumia flava]
MVVVGGGLAGMAAAVRIAKLRHRVVLVEDADRVGGRLLPLVHDGFSFDHGSSEVTLPATLRDLFRKSGRPLDSELELVPLPVARRHVLGDGDVLDLPTGSRAAQTDAIDQVLGRGSGARWTRWLDAYTDVWEVLRTRALEQPFEGRAAFDNAQWRMLRPRAGLQRAARRGLRDPRLRALVIDRHRLDGEQPGLLPAFLGVLDLVERSFGRWRVVGGTSALVTALERRLAQRRVDVRTGVRALDVVGTDRVEGVRTADGVVSGDVVVWAAPAAPGGRRESDALPRVPAARTYLGLGPDAPRLEQETIVHDHAPLRISPSATHDGPGQAWTVEHLGAEDPVDALARHGLRLSAHVRARVDVSALDAVRDGGARYGWCWSGWRTGCTLPGVGRPRPAGLLRIGANAHPGASLEAVTLGAASAAETLRPPTSAAG